MNPHRSGGYLRVAGGKVAVGIGIIVLIVATTWAGNRLGGATRAPMKAQPRGDICLSPLILIIYC
ncbi:MAG TPA: hypothetical protein VK781_05250 [Solirubrobacteraceae bacterium]|nr:hypothetical protein [Solirubrobacteraceae bacterium]